ncbi:hypothetical protein [Microcoleus sp. CAWBG58]|uniref:hypothetical protein n=1 Tax=Microcoleus sp. CAWBG58 TaxID=2841651 RepID=UPI0025D05E9F|nr:hypothetical protein [Microcoleus sp. CAWBG58]
MSSLFVLTFLFSTPAFCLDLVNPQWVGLSCRAFKLHIRDDAQSPSHKTWIIS